MFVMCCLMPSLLRGIARVDSASKFPHLPNAIGTRFDRYEEASHCFDVLPADVTLATQ